MSASLQDLYQEVILDHNRHPRNFRAMADARQAEGHNPLCGDRLTVYVRIENGRVEDVSFEGAGRAISKASASLMTEAVKGKTLDDIDRLSQRFHQMITAGPDARADELGKLAVFAGVRQVPIRVKCASLAWHALRAAAHARSEVVSTE